MLDTRDDSSGYQWKAYAYQLNFGVNLEFCVLFGVLAACQIGSMIRQRISGKNLPNKLCKRYVGTLAPFLTGLILECVGYVGRLLNHKDNTLLGPYILQSIVLLIAPAFMAASIYMNVGEVIKLHEAEAYFIIPTKWFTKIFVIGDIMSILLQAAGGGIQSSGSLASFNTGRIMIIAGLWVQIAFFSVYILTSILFTIRYFPKSKASWIISGFRRDSWFFMLSGLLITSVFILIRSIYRVIEYLQGDGGQLISNEVYLFVLDSTMIFFGGCVYLGNDITYNLSKLYFRKNSQEEYEMVNENGNNPKVKGS